jgi:hypothetical protein
MDDQEIIKAVRHLQLCLAIYHGAQEEEHKDFEKQLCFCILQDFIDNIQNRKHDVDGQYENAVDGKLAL